MKLRLLLGLALLPACQPMDIGSESAALGSTSMVFSQVYTAGGNSGAAIKSSYVELFNRGGAAQNLGGWSLQYSGATSNSWSTRFSLPAASVPAGGYFLVELDTGSTGAALAQTPDATASTFSPAASSGKLALVNSTSALTCGPAGSTSCSGVASVVDLFGWGSANDYETAAAAAPASGNNAVYVRGGNGCADGNDNSTDFTKSTTAVATPTAHTSASAAAPCSTAPVDMTRSPVDLITPAPVDLAGGADFAQGPADLARAPSDLAAPPPGDIVPGTTPKNGNSGCSTSGTPDRVGLVLVMLAIAFVRRYRRQSAVRCSTRP